MSKMNKGTITFQAPGNDVDVKATVATPSSAPQNIVLPKPTAAPKAVTNISTVTESLTDEANSNQCNNLWSLVMDPIPGCPSTQPYAGDNVIGTTTGATHVPFVYPTIGDPFMSQSGQQTSGFIQVPYPAVPQYWGVQARSLPSHKAGPAYWIVNPATLLSLPLGARIVARTETENDALAIVLALIGTLPDEDQEEKVKKDPSLVNRKKYELLMFAVKKLEGQILTVLDAAFNNEAQNKATKSLAKHTISEFRNRIWKYFFDDQSDGDCDDACSDDKDAFSR